MRFSLSRSAPVLKAKPLKPKKCKNCRGSFEPRNSMQIVCSPRCGLEFAEKQRNTREAKLAKLDRAQHRERKEAIKTRADYVKDAQAAFNAWIRERDKGQPCISCGTTANVQYCAGHYRTTAAAPELRFHPLNVHLQCNRNCNMGKSGNIVEYRKRLVEKIGADMVEWLEGHHDPKRYTVEDLKRIAREYRAKVRELKRKI